MVNFRGLLAIGLSLLLLVSNISAAATPDSASVVKTSTGPNTTSLRLTHALYKLVIGAYLFELQNRYRPDLVAQGRYMQDFLEEWNRALEKGEVKTAREFFEGMRSHPSILGPFYDVWVRIHLGLLGKKPASEWIDLNLHRGHGRVNFLADVLNSETALSEKDRALKIVQSIAINLTNQEDEVLGALLLASFEFTSNAEALALSKSMLANVQLSTRYQKIIRNSRMAAVGLVVGPVVGLWGATTAVGSRLRALLPFELLGKTSTTTKAVAASVAAHAAVLGSNFEKEKVEQPKKLPESEIAVAAMLSATANQLMSIAGQTVSDKPTATVKARLMSKSEWTLIGNEVLAGRMPPNFDFGTFMLNYEHLNGYWGKETALTSTIAFSRLESAYKALEEIDSSANQTEKVEIVRKILFKHFLAQYVEAQRTLTSVFLTWGGNCVSSTVVMVAALQKHKHLIPNGYQVGVASIVGHLEPVLISKDDIHFLTEGTHYPSSLRISVLKPEALIYSALVDAGVKPTESIDRFYIIGNPALVRQKVKVALLNKDSEGSSDSVAAVVKGFWARAANKIDETLYGRKEELGVAGGLGSFPIRSDGMVADNSRNPKRARQSYSRSSNAAQGASDGLIVLNPGAGLDTKAFELGDLNSKNSTPWSYIETVMMAGKPTKFCLYTMSRPDSCVGDPAHESFMASMAKKCLPGAPEELWIGSTPGLPIVVSLGFSDVASARQALQVPVETLMWHLFKGPIDKTLEPAREKFKITTSSIGPADVTRFRRLELRDGDEKILRLLLSPEYQSNSIALAGSLSDDIPKVFGAGGQQSPAHKLRAMRELTKDALMARGNSAALSLVAEQPIEAYIAISLLVGILRDQMIQDPAGFMKAFASWPSQVRAAFVGHRLQLLEAYPPSPPATARLRNLLNNLGKDQIKVVPPPEEEKQELCLEPGLTLPTIGEGASEAKSNYLRIYKNAPRVCDKAGSDDGRLETKPKKAIAVVGKKLQIDAEVLAQLSLLSSGGVHLWTKDTLNVVERKMPAWIAAGLEMEVDEVPESLRDVETVFKSHDDGLLDANSRLRAQYEAANEFILESYYRHLGSAL